MPPARCRLAAVLSLAGLASGLVGCNSAVRTPRWTNPGNAAQQQYDAIVHDPYPLTDAGPEIVGARPQGYEAPVPTVRRGRLFTAPRNLAPPR